MQDKDKEQELDWQMREKCWRLDLEMARQRGDALRDRWLQAEKERVESLEMYQRAIGVVGSMERSRDEWKALARHRWALLERAEREREDARHEKAQMQLRLESAEKECSELRKRVASDFVAPGPKKRDIIGRDIHGNRFQDK